MDWDIINGITGVVSAICALIGLWYMVVPHKKELDGQYKNRIISVDRFMVFLLACSGWVLCCLSFLWFFEPLGSLVSDREFKQFYAVLMAFPAIVIFLTALRIMNDA